MAAKLKRRPNFVFVFSLCFILGGENLFLFTSSFGLSVSVHLVYRLQVLSQRQCFDILLLLRQLVMNVDCEWKMTNYNWGEGRFKDCKLLQLFLKINNPKFKQFGKKIDILNFHGFVFVMPVGTYNFFFPEQDMLISWSFSSHSSHENIKHQLLCSILKTRRF